MNEPCAPAELVDSHCHLTSEPISRQLEMFHSQARAAGVMEMITVATDAADSHRAVAVADHYAGVHCTVGIHPHHAGAAQPEDWRTLQELRHNPRVVAWGETGLDYHYDFAPRAAQREVFLRQLQLAAGSGLPVIIHCREAVADTVAILKESGFCGRRVVFHCFTGAAHEAGTIRDHGWRLSFTGIVTFRGSRELQAVAREYPLEDLMLETDAPYLSPEPHRQVKPNHPALLIHTARFLSELRGVPLPELAARTAANARRFFDLHLA
jgi:TatD DNase family protein